jgi:hypothetical protein
MEGKWAKKWWNGKGGQNRTGTKAGQKKVEGGFPGKAKTMTGWDMAGNRGMMAGQSAIDQPPSFEEMASLAPMSQPAGYSFGWKPALG